MTQPDKNLPENRDKDLDKNRHNPNENSFVGWVKN